MSPPLLLLGIRSTWRSRQDSVKTNSLYASGGPWAMVPYERSSVLVSRRSIVVASVRGRWGSKLCLRRRWFFSWTGAVEGVFFLKLWAATLQSEIQRLGFREPTCFRFPVIWGRGTIRWWRNLWGFSWQSLAGLGRPGSVKSRMWFAGDWWWWEKTVANGRDGGHYAMDERDVQREKKDVFCFV